jgi:hypothetical protein
MASYVHPVLELPGNSETRTGDARSDLSDDTLDMENADHGHPRRTGLATGLPSA